MSAPLDLAKRVEQLPGERIDRRTLIDIFKACRPRPSFETGKRCDAARNWFIRSWEDGACLSAAMTLLPEGWKLRQANFSAPCADDRKWHLNLHGGSVGQDAFVGRGATPAMAFAVAAISATAAIGGAV